MRSEKPMSVIDNSIIPALNEVGTRFEQKKAFLPQLLMSAEASAAAFDVLKKKIGKSTAVKAKFVLADLMDKKSLDDLFKNNNIDAVIHFAAFAAVGESVENPEKYYSESSIICLSSSTEGFGMVLVEALKYKCIPIAYNSFAALSDIIVDGVNGYAIPPFKEKLFIEKLHYLMSNENERMRLADNNAVTLHKFDINRVTQQWLNLFNNLLN